jgi:outer membrane protein OmpA-like peptidoglycan-associated protein
MLGVLAAGIAAAAGAAEPADSASDDCVGRFRLRGPIFDFATLELEPGLPQILDEVAKTALASCPSKTVVVESHATDLPTPELNQLLSELRARGIRYELLRRGLPEDRVRAVGLGDSQPLAAGSGPDARRLNRRITFRAE